MSSRRLRSALADERGIALPLSLIVLVLLTSLTLAFLAMSSTEPLIASNLQAGEQALALAEAGVERAIWALNNPTAAAPAQGLITPLPASPPSPYDGLTAVSLDRNQVLKRPRARVRARRPGRGEPRRRAAACVAGASRHQWGGRQS